MFLIYLGINMGTIKIPVHPFYYTEVQYSENGSVKMGERTPTRIRKFSSMS